MNDTLIVGVKKDKNLGTSEFTFGGKLLDFHKRVGCKEKIYAWLLNACPANKIVWEIKPKQFPTTGSLVWSSFSKTKPDPFMFIMSMWVDRG